MKNAAPARRSNFPLFALALLLAVPAGVKAQPADLRTTDLSTIDPTYNYSLGPTGMRGFMLADDHGNAKGMDDSWTAGSWQILVVAVGASTPASGIMASNDVILGFSTGAGTPVPVFSYSATNDVRKSMGWAIGAAEASDGKLNIKRWRAGVTTDVTLQLQVMGAYSPTAPYNCPKSALILSNACHRLAQKSSDYKPDPFAPVWALALLASGDTNYLPTVQAYARSIAPANLLLRAAPGQAPTVDVWGWGYKGIFLAEYYLLTGDTNVLHGINEAAVALAQGQSMYGTMCHGPASLNADGSFHGSVGWYGPVNQGGLTANLAIVMGNKCLVASGMPIDPEIPAAINRAANFFGYYVEKGSIPYGEHEPCTGFTLGGGHSSNGKDCSAAVLFAMMGDQPAATEYFTRMTVSGYNGREYGHTGQGFSYLWGAMGANIGGTNAVASYLAQVRWHLDLERRCDGSFVYDGGEQGGGTASYDYWNTADYGFMDPTSWYVLTYALPQQKLLITGRNANPTNWLSSDEVTNAIWAGVFHQACTSYSTNQLLSAFGEYDPQVRDFAASQFGSLGGASSWVPALTNMAASSTNSWLREAACKSLGVIQDARALPVLGRALSDPDNWVRKRAGEALLDFGAAASPQLTTMLTAFTNNATPRQPIDWTDPVQIANGYLANALFNTGLQSSTKSVAKTLLYPAVQTGLKQPDGMALTYLDNFVSSDLTLADIEALIPDLFVAVEVEAPADRMFTPSIRQTVIGTLAQYDIAEAVPLALTLLDSDLTRAAGLSALAAYGEAARWTLPDLYADIVLWGTADSNYGTLLTTIALIEAATSTPALIDGVPEADPQIVATPANTANVITLTASSCRTNVLTYAVATQPAHGTLSGTTANVTYTPAANYQGLDSFTFTAADSLTNSSPARVDIVVGAGGTGLKGLYYDNLDFTSLKAAMTNGTIDFDWGSVPPTNSMGVDTYSVRWTGQVLAPETGTYRFSTRTTDGVRLWVNGMQVINDWKDQAANIWNDSAPIALTAGQKYSLKMEYYRNVNPATVRLYWYIPSGQAATIIPQTVLYPASGVSLTSPLDGAHFGMPAGLPGTVVLTADVGDAGSSITNVSFYAGGLLIGSDATPPYVAAWTGVTAGQYSLTARATDNNGTVSTSAVAVITVDTNTVPVTAGLACYYDSSVGITTDANGVVQTWNDRSGNAHNATLVSGLPVLGTSAPMSKPVVQFRGNATWFDCAGGFFTKEQYVVVRSPDATWSGSGSFLGRASSDFLTVRASSYNLYSGYTGFWDDQLPVAVSKNGTVVSSGHGSMPRGGFELGTITNFMLLKITVNDAASAANLAAYPYYQIGQNETLGSCEMDIAEIIGYDHALPPNDEALVGGYLAAKYGISTPYRVAGFVANLPATGIATNSAGLNASLNCNGTNLAGYAFWGTVNGGSNATLWTRSAYVGAWTNVASTNLSFTATGLAPSTTYYFTFRATNALSDVWADTVLSFTTLGPPLVDNSAGASNLVAGVAQLQGTLANGPADVRFFWGTTDAGTNGPWANTNLLAGAASGAVSANVSNLLYGLRYYYRCSASNQFGMTWAPATASFTTLPPQVPATLLVTNGLVCWYDASFGVATNGSGVTAWNDESGFGHQASRASGTVTLVSNDANSRPAVHLRGSSTWLNCAGGMFTKEQYLVVRSPNITWNGSGSFLGRESDTFLSVRASSYNMDSGTVGFWQDHFPTAVSKNGTALALNQQGANGPGFELGTITDYMLLKIIVDNTADAANLAAYPYYQIGKNETLGTMDFDVAEIIGYGATNSAAAEASIGSYLATKYGLTTAYPGFTGPPAASLMNSPATAVSNAAAMLHATLGCTGSVYGVVACWNTINGGTNAALWANSAYLGSWTNLASTNLSFTATGLAPSTTYYFTFRATNAVDTLWAANVQSFTTLAPVLPPTPVLPVSGVKVTGGVPSFSFTAAASCKYRLDYKNALTDANWSYGPWSTNMAGSNQPMTLTDPSATGQPHRFYRLEGANP